MTDYRVEFSRWWVKEFKQVKFPSTGTVFDFCIDKDTKKFVPWTDNVPKFEMDPDLPLQVDSQNSMVSCDRLGLFMIISSVHDYVIVIIL